MELPKQVIVLEFDEPTIKNVIGVNLERRMLQLQTPDKPGSDWRSFDDVMSEVDVYWNLMCKAASEIRRLEIKESTIKILNS